MAQKVIHTMVCDLTGAEGTPDEIQTVYFTVLGRELEMDLSEQARKDFEAAWEKYITVARPVRTARAAMMRRATTTRRDRSRDADSAKVRAWAIAAGKPVSERGRIPRAILDEYEACGGEVPTQAPAETPKARRSGPKAAQDGAAGK